MEKLEKFSAEQIGIVDNCVSMAEELVSNFYKMSASQWSASCKYDIKTMVDLSSEETIFGPFAQIIRYQGQRKDSSLGSSTYDFYKICLQDHTILAVLGKTPGMQLYPFILYIVLHELIHIIRFSKFLQNFDASHEEITAEEIRVHEITRQIISNIRISGLKQVLKFYDNWRIPFDDLRNLK
ncbi:MAG: hypothetical protein IMF00_05345 [Proteobacteria bacterium]|jgi:hypothetical protein|nr:hypothetical protein [Pseudomonadota bacterium]